MPAQKVTFFWGEGSVYSNFHPSPFVLDGIPFSCVEQYYMYSKAGENLRQSFFVCEILKLFISLCHLFMTLSKGHMIVPSSDALKELMFIQVFNFFSVLLRLRHCRVCHGRNLTKKDESSREGGGGLPPTRVENILQSCHEKGHNG